MVLIIKYLEHNDFITEKNSIICLGYFDGMHIAHIDLIKKAKKMANDKGLSLAVFTFTQNIKSYMNQEQHRCLTTINDKVDICRKLGVDYLYVMKVSKNLIHMEANEFVNRFLIDANTIVVGFDFSFGYNGEGNRHLLKHNKNFHTLIIPEMKYLDLKVGSTRIAEALLDGNLDLANYLLGRPYSIKGKVVSGRKIAGKLGYPTANIDYLPYNLPKSGVFYTKVFLHEKSYYGVTNVGVKPTYDNLPVTVETYVFDINKDLYNDEIRIEFIEYIRPEIKFNSELELSEQIYHDIEDIKVKIKEANYA